MRVRIYESDTVTLYTECDLTEALEDDDERYAVENEIARAGRCWIGGGASPLMYVVPVR